MKTKSYIAPGQRFGMLLVIAKRIGKWRVSCDCGASIDVAAGELNRGRTSCGCTAKNRPDIIGERFGRLLVVASAGRDQKSRQLWKCHCECGGTAILTTGRLRAGETQSCGCLLREHVTSQQTVPGRLDEAGNVSPEYACWLGMHKRCTDPDAVNFERYGGRGITVCERWESFVNFLADMGRKPSVEHSIDRIDNDKGYEPGNCRWATLDVQAQNRRNTVWLTGFGKRQCLAQWARELGISETTIRRRTKAGETIEQVAQRASAA